jgi:hypothetical protein
VGYHFKIKTLPVGAGLLAKETDMRFGWRTHLPLAALLGATLAALSLEQQSLAQGDKKDNTPFKRIPFRSVDGVELQGTYYHNSLGKKDACVLLLHNISRTKGGNSHQDGWDHLAEALQKEGYAVLSFDFRGFGESKSVSKDFWEHRHNQSLRVAARRPETIDQKDFPPAYYPQLVNDIAAAKAFLDRKNDAGELNSSNLIIIGAGEGATLGAMWMAAEWKRQRALGGNMLDEPEGRDQACGIWLTISPSLAGQNQPVKALLVEVGRDRKVPMAFLFGKTDATGKQIATNYVKAIKTPTSGKKLDPLVKDFTGEHEIAGTNLTGSKLLQNSLETEKWILKDDLEKVMDKRGARERKKRDSDRSVFYWVLKSGLEPILAKAPNEELPRPIPDSVIRPSSQ